MSSYPRQEEPSLDRACYNRIEVEFEIPVYLTADQIEMLHYIVKDICSDPQNTPVGRSHEINAHGPKPLFSLHEVAMDGEIKLVEGSEKLWDEDALYFGSSVR